MSSFKRFAKDWLPPVIIRALNKLNPAGIRFKGNYKSWSEASAVCTGYDAELILDRVLEATQKVKQGEVAFERDSVTFDEVQYSWPVTAALLLAAARNSSDLNVLDFGGALGSSYFQNKKFLNKLSHVSWTVVEQESFFETGKKYIADDILKFMKDIDDYSESTPPNLVLLSSVLQYLPEPFEVLNKITNIKANFIVIDRTPFSTDSVERIKVQYVPASIYPASYPCWFLNRNDLIRKMKQSNYELIESFDALDELSNQAKWQGLIFERVN